LSTITTDIPTLEENYKNEYLIIPMTYLGNCTLKSSKNVQIKVLFDEFHEGYSSGHILMK
jgi:hypothetical protein